MEDFVERITHWSPEMEIDTVPDSVLQSYWERHSVINMVENLPAEDLQAVRWYIDCGDDDFLLQRNALVNIALHEREIPHEFRVRRRSYLDLLARIVARGAAVRLRRVPPILRCDGERGNYLTEWGRKGSGAGEFDFGTGADLGQGDVQCNPRPLYGT